MRLEIPEKSLSTEIRDFGDQIRDYLDKLVNSKQLNIVPSYLDKSKTSEKARETISNAVQVFMFLGCSFISMKEEKKKLHRPNAKRSDKSKKSFYQITNKTFSVELLGLETQLGRVGFRFM